MLTWPDGRPGGRRTSPELQVNASTYLTRKLPDYRRIRATVCPGSPTAAMADEHECGCGATFETEEALKEHAREVHVTDVQPGHPG